MRKELRTAVLARESLEFGTFFYQVRGMASVQAGCITPNCCSLYSSSS